MLTSESLQGADTYDLEQTPDVWLAFGEAPQITAWRPCSHIPRQCAAFVGNQTGMTTMDAHRPQFAGTVAIKFLTITHSVCWESDRHDSNELRTGHEFNVA